MVGFANRPSIRHGKGSAACGSCRIRREAPKEAGITTRMDEANGYGRPVGLEAGKGEYYVLSCQRFFIFLLVWSSPVIDTRGSLDQNLKLGLAVLSKEGRNAVGKSVANGNLGEGGSKTIH